MKPTEAQIKEFWEGCGWKYKPDELCGDPRSPHIKHSYGWQAPDDYKWQTFPPDIDLNNLFLYAVPKEVNGITSNWNDKEVTVMFMYPDKTSRFGVKNCWGRVKRTDNLEKDLADALFWALRKVKNENQA